MFQQGGLDYSRKFSPEIDGFIYQSDDQRLTVFVCDFFKMKLLDGLEKCDAVYDRGAFEAIFEADREAYVQLILNMLKSDFRYILNAYEYQDEVFKGPPRACTREEVVRLFNGHKRDNGLHTKTEILSEEDYREYGRS